MAAALRWFRVLLRGENFPLEVDDAEEIVGFYTTRFVQATDSVEAGAEACARLLGEPALVAALEAHPGAPPRVYVDEVENAIATDIPVVPQGMVFFDADE